jgi:hypothetical protein
MRIIRVLALLVLVGSIPVAAGAGPIVAGDVVKFSDLPGNTGGGEFKLTDVGNAADWIITFCLQKTEYMNFSNNFIVDSINPYTLTDPYEKGGDPQGRDWISSQTAWLYTQFTDGTLAGYAYNGTAAQRSASADALQHAFWMWEGEEAVDESNYYYALAKNHTPQNFGTGDVAVMNLKLYNPGAQNHLAEAQDQLIRVSVPEPATLTLMGAGMLGMAAVRRRRRPKA